LESKITRNTFTRIAKNDEHIKTVSKEITMSNDTLKTLYVDELRDLLDAENQLIKAIPEMAKASTSNQLRSGLEHHLEQTKNHARRIEQILEALGEAPKGKKCKGMQGIVAEGKEILDEDYEGALMDAGIISAAQRVEHYEIGAYGCVREYAQFLGENEAVSLLSQTLEEEKETDQKLTELAHTINKEAARGNGTPRTRSAQA
jgi:ferritin-like metal-binding protein YciE